MKTQLSLFAAALVVVTTLVAPALVHANESSQVYANSAKLYGCFSFDRVSGDPKPNTRDAGCKVVSNVPGEKETTLIIDTSVNTGTLAQPQERPTRVEIRVGKDKGKPVSFEQKVIDTGSGKADTTRYDLGVKGEIKNGSVQQGDATYAMLDKDRCKDLKPLSEAIGLQPIVQCLNIAQQAVEPIKKINDELAKSKLRLGTPQPSIAMPSLMEWKAIDAQKMGDVFMVLTTCASTFALEKAMNQPPPGAKGQTSQGLSVPSAPQTRPAPARQ